MRVLFIEPYPTEGPSSRYRIEQYIPYLERSGVECIVRPFISSGFYKIIYKKGLYLKKAIFFLNSSIKRLFDIFTALRCDIIFIHLETYPFGPAVFEWIFKRLGKKIIYDLDDAIYLGKTSSANQFIKFLKMPSKIEKIIKMSDHIITCNKYLADYARRFNANVTPIHTSVDTERFFPKHTDGDVKKNVTIGWIGSHSTTPYLAQLKDVFNRLSLEHKFELKIIGASTKVIDITGINVIYKDWRLEDEIGEFQSLDIGVYPLPDNEWILGKTGFKTIQYMSVGIPCVVSSLGTNKEIVKEGINGYLARTDEEWIEKLSLLINNRDLRAKIGLAARKTVEENYSVKVNAPKYLEILRQIRNEQ